MMLRVDNIGWVNDRGGVLDFQGPPVPIEAGIPIRESIPLALAWLRSKGRSPRVGLGAIPALSDRKLETVMALHARLHGTVSPGQAIGTQRFAGVQRGVRWGSMGAWGIATKSILIR